VIEQTFPHTESKKRETANKGTISKEEINTRSSNHTIIITEQPMSHTQNIGITNDILQQIAPLEMNTWHGKCNYCKR
jgi:hypothetical protein